MAATGHLSMFALDRLSKEVNGPCRVLDVEWFAPR